MKKLKLLFVLSIVFIFIFNLFFSTTTVFSQNFKSFSIGYGPLEGEAGFPVVVDKDSSGRIVILDALKPAISIFDNTQKYSNSFSISNSIPPNITNVSLKVSMDGFICILINNTIIKYNFDGTLVQSYSLHENRFLLGKSIQLFTPLSGDYFSFKDDLTGEIFIASLKQDQEPIKLARNNSPLSDVIDIASYKDMLCFLIAGSNAISNSSPSLALYSSQGIFLKETNLIDIPLFGYPQGCSFDLDGNIYLLDTNFNLAVFSSNLALLDKVIVPNINLQDFSKTFSAYRQKGILLCNPTKGAYLLKDNSELKMLCPVVKKEGKLFTPSSVCGNRENLFVYDSSTHLINHYQFDIYKQSFSVEDFISLTSYQSKISLFQSNSSSFFVVYQGIETKIKKIDPTTGTRKDIIIPSYISPRSSVYIRSKDNQIYFYSWFDSILYIFQENSDLPVKIQINKVSNAMFSSDCICKIDTNDTIYILLPNLKKMNVFNSSGSLITGFTLNSEGFSYFTSFDFNEDLLVILDYFNSRLDFYSKRGEKLFSTGKKGFVLYPKTEKGYSENSDSLLFPTTVVSIQSKILVTDTGNSRVVIFEGEKLIDKITIELQLGSKSAYVNQKRTELDVAPFTENGRTLVPFRFIGEALGAKVTWNQETKKAIYELASVKVEISIGSQIAVVNGKEIKLDVAPKISNGRTFVPIRFVSEALGASVIWEASTKKIIITYPGN
jgi:hypothetical protein